MNIGKNTKLSILLIQLIQFSAWAVPLYDEDGNKLYLDGRVIARHFISPNEKINGDAALIRLNLWAETEINSQLYGYGRFEHDFRGNKSEVETQGANYTRYAYTGLDAHEYGNVDYGKSDGIFYDVVRWTDIFPVWGASSFSVDNFMARRGSGMLSYHNRGLFSQVAGLDVGLQYQGRNDDNTRPVLTQNGKGYGASLTYQIPATGISVGGSYISAGRTTKQKKLDVGNGDRMEAWVTALKLDAAPFYAAALYSEGRNLSRVKSSHLGISGYATQAQSFEAVASWDTPYKLIASVGYMQTKAKRIINVGNAWLDKSCLLFMAYPFNNNFRLTAEYKMSLLNADNSLGIENDNALALTMIFIF